MSAPILNSNANSALISTLSSSDALVNPYEYSLEKMLPFGAKYTTEVLPVQGGGQTYKSNSVIDFDLPKWGMLMNACLQFGLIKNSSAKAVGFSQIGALSAIENIELLSSSRRILNLSYKDIMCMWSDYPASQREGIITHLQEYGDGIATDASTHETFESPRYQINIPFSLFFSHKINPNLLFQEPLRVRVHLSNLIIGTAAQAASGTFLTPDETHQVYSPVLTAEYFNPPRELEDKTIQDNYSDGSLSIVCYDWHDENEVVAQNGVVDNTPYNANTYLECEIKDVGVVSDIYFMISLDRDNTIEGTGTANEKADRITPAQRKLHRGAEPIVRCELTANGQIIFSKTSEELKTWGRKSDTIYPFSMGNPLSSHNSLDNVFKIPLCLSDDKRYPCGGMSLRELHNVKLRVWYKATSTAGAANHINNAVLPANDNADAPTMKPSLKVMLKKYQILTTESSSGRVITSVAN